MAEKGQRKDAYKLNWQSLRAKNSVDLKGTPNCHHPADLLDFGKYLVYARDFNETGDPQRQPAE
jgi:hypothetical protein